MSFELPFSIKITNPYPVIETYMNGNLPYVSILEANTATVGIRHIGMTVNINNVEYHYKDGILDEDLVVKNFEEPLDTLVIEILASNITTTISDYVNSIGVTVGMNDIIYYLCTDSKETYLFLKRNGSFGLTNTATTDADFLKFGGGDNGLTTRIEKSVQIYTSGLQEFTLPTFAQIIEVSVNGVSIEEYTVLSDTLVRIDLPLEPTVRVVILYLVDEDTNIAPYYTQAQVDALMSNTGVTPVTYDELMLLISNSQLVEGGTYLLTDYMTTYIQPVTNIPMSSDITEQLYLTAVDVNALHNIAKSKLYPKDIVYYDVYGDIDNGFGTEGFTKGKIYRRIDTIYNNDIGTDWRHIKYNKNSQDRKFFPNNSIGRNNVISIYRLFNSVVGEGFNDNKITFLYNTTIGNYCTGNTCEEISSCTIGDYFQQNKIMNDFSNNTILFNFYKNNIKSKFKYNTVSSFFTDNIIEDNFSQNSIDTGFKDNEIEKNITGITFGSNIRKNTFFVGQLPILSTNSSNQRFIVKDALNPVYLSNVIGGGTVIAPVMWNGSNWVVC